MLLEIIIIIFSTLIIYNWWAHGYWKRRNVFSIPTEFLFGNIRKIITGHALVPQMFDDMYKKYKEHKMIGFYTFYDPMLFVRDPEIVKKILVSEFNSFSDNGFTLSKDVDPLLGFNPFTAKGVPLWKELRSIQASNMTPLKLKEVVPNLTTRIGEFMYDFIKNQEKQPVSVMDLSIRAAVDSAVFYGFGIEPKSFTDSEFGFMKHASGDKLFQPSTWNIIAALFIPLLNKFCNLRVTSYETEEFFKSMTKTNIEHRLNSKVTRGDIIDTILKANKKKLEQTHKAYTDLEMSAHCTTFYLDSTVTSGMALTFFLLELAKHPDIQERLRSEIISVGNKPEDFDYDKINSITYLQMVLDETLRVHSPLSFVSRICTKDTIIEDVKIEKGTRIYISSISLHTDPEYFPDPEKFDPERFSEINKESMTKYTFFPFGEGPRICVGMKYASIFVKTSIVLFLLKYRVLPCGNQDKCLHDYDNFLLIPKPDAAVKFEEL
ncbi:cytochrome P450 6k1 [Halyomorpha halys]|uniref:cytochrome P450 6k1 n=1 Tax=Halyomorpha halys TaxID=286706 RepID=UPI0006D513D1|nr:cytochrome P450 6k1 [Halyomorpha halys]